MNVRVVIVCLGMTLLAGVGCPALAETARERRSISYDSEWILDDFEPGFEVHDADEEEERQRRRIRDDGTGAFRRQDRRSDAPTFNHLPGMFQAPIQPTPSAAEQRPRNWLLPSSEDDSLRLWGEPEEREESGWGWLADEVEQRRLIEEEERERRRVEEEEDEPTWRPAQPEREEDNRLPQMGALVFDGDQTNNRDVDRLASMSPDELQEWVAQQDALGLEQPFDGFDAWNADQNDTPSWAANRSNGELQNSGLFTADDQSGRWGSGFESAPWSQESAWGGRNNGEAAAGTTPSRFVSGRNAGVADAGARRSAFFDTQGNDRSDTGLAGFGSTANAGGGWTANWSGDSDWQSESGAAGTGSGFGSSQASSLTPVDRPTISSFPLHNDGRLSAP